MEGSEEYEQPIRLKGSFNSCYEYYANEENYLGGGSFAWVYRGFRTKSIDNDQHEVECAFKVFKLDNRNRKTIKKSFFKEVNFQVEFSTTAPP